MFVFFSHELLYLLYPYLSLFLPLLFSTSLFLFLSATSSIVVTKTVLICGLFIVLTS